MAKPGLAEVFGKKGGADEDALDGGADDAAEGDGVSAEVQAAWEDYDAEPSAEGFARAVKACMGSY